MHDLRRWPISLRHNQGSCFEEAITVNCRHLLGLVASLLLAAHVHGKTASPRQLFFTEADVVRVRKQIAEPELRMSCEDLQGESEKLEQRWRNQIGRSNERRSAGELVAWGRAHGMTVGFETVAVAGLQRPNDRRGTVLREMLLAMIGARQIQHYWRPLGVHEAEVTMRFLQSVDIAQRLGLLNEEDWSVMRDELRQTGHFLEGWLLGNSFSAGYDDQRVRAYCLNFHTYAASSLGCLALCFPEMPEAHEWLYMAELSLMTEFLTENFRDGGCAEGSTNYWMVTIEAVLNFIVLRRNTGGLDYFTVPAVADALRRTTHWRLDLTAPDGRTIAVGDSPRHTRGARYLQLVGANVGDPELVWGARMLWRRANDWKMNSQGLGPLDLVWVDLSLAEKEPAKAPALYESSGFAVMRSGWGADDNALIFKYGPTYSGRRQVDQGLVISGHAHQDCLEFELHRLGRVVLADLGSRGQYSNWPTYGGFVKSTVAHSTVGLGNPQGYDRLDGRLEEHRKQDGAEFRYEVPQDNIHPDDVLLLGHGLTDYVGVVAAKVRTYREVSQQRTLVWFPADSLTVVQDRLESDREHPYEWYLTPVGTGKGGEGAFEFGDAVAELTVYPIASAHQKSQLINYGDERVPAYYVTLTKDRNDIVGAHSFDPKDRMGRHSLLIFGQNGKAADFLSVLVPHGEDDRPWTVTRMGDDGARLNRGVETVLVLGAKRSMVDRLESVGDLAVARLVENELQSVAFTNSSEIRFGGQPLFAAQLSSAQWSGLYDYRATGLISRGDKRATVALALSPTDMRLVCYGPQIEPNKEPLVPIAVTITLRTITKPRKLVMLDNASVSPKLADPIAVAKTQWPNDPHGNRYLRHDVTFRWDEATGCVSFEVGPGPHQIVWE